MAYGAGYALVGPPPIELPPAFMVMPELSNPPGTTFPPTKSPVPRPDSPIVEPTDGIHWLIAICPAAMSPPNAIAAPNSLSTNAPAQPDASAITTDPATAPKALPVSAVGSAAMARLLTPSPTRPPATSSTIFIGFTAVPRN